MLASLFTIFVFTIFVIIWSLPVVLVHLKKIIFWLLILLLFYCKFFFLLFYFNLSSSSKLEWIYIYNLVPKGAQMGGQIFDCHVSIKYVSNTLSYLLLLCVCVHNWSVSQWKQYELPIWSSWRNIYFWKWKAPRNSTPENGHTHGEWFQCFYSHTWQIKTLPQSPICIGRFSEAGLHEWVPFVIFRARSRERSQRHVLSNFWVGVASRCV